MLKNIFKIKTLCILSALLVHAPAHTMQISKTRAAGNLALRMLKNAPRTIAAHPYLSIAAVSVAVTAKDFYSNYNKHARRVTKIKKEIAEIQDHFKKTADQAAAMPQEQQPLSAAALARQKQRQELCNLLDARERKRLADLQAELPNAEASAQAAKDQTFGYFLRRVHYNSNNFFKNLETEQSCLLAGAIIAPVIVGLITGVSTPMPYVSLGISKLFGTSPMIKEYLGFANNTFVPLTGNNVHQISKNYLLGGGRLTMKLAGTGAVIGASLLVKAWLKERDNQAREAVIFRAQVAKDVPAMVEIMQNLKNGLEETTRRLREQQKNRADAAGAAAEAPQP